MNIAPPRMGACLNAPGRDLLSPTAADTEGTTVQVSAALTKEAARARAATATRLNEVGCLVVVVMGGLSARAMSPD